MLHAKCQPDRPSGSGEEVVRIVFTKMHDGHLEFRIMTFIAKSCITIK